MALSYVTYTGDGATTNFTFDKGYIQESDVSVYLDGVLQTITTDYIWFNATTVQFTTAPGSSVAILIERNTQNTSRLVDFQDAGNLTEADLDLSANQTFYLMQEAFDDFNDQALGQDTDNKWDAGNFAIKNVADPTNNQDAATKAYGDSNWGGASATAAAASAAAAATSETNAATSETNAATSASNASTSETNAAASASAAATSATNAENSYDSFDDRYLGAKASDPSLDNDGDALLTGALYFNTSSNEMKVYNGTVWSSVTSAGSYVLKAGDTMTGALTLSGDPTAALHAATKQYVDAGDAAAARSVAVLEYKVASGTNSETYTASSYQTVNLNTEVSDADSIVTLATKQFTPVSGTYRVDAFALLNDNGGTGSYKVRIRNVTAGTTAIVGSNGISGNISMANVLRADGVLTANGTDAYELQVYTTRATDAITAASSGESEVYARVILDAL